MDMYHCVFLWHSGKGFYNYGKPGGRKAEVDPEVTQMIMELSEKAGITRRHIPAQVKFGSFNS